jgi:hypothetical protein
MRTLLGVQCYFNLGDDRPLVGWMSQVTSELDKSACLYARELTTGLTAEKVNSGGQ